MVGSSRTGCNREATSSQKHLHMFNGRTHLFDTAVMCWQICRVFVCWVRSVVRQGKGSGREEQRSKAWNGHVKVSSEVRVDGQQLRAS